MSKIPPAIDFYQTLKPDLCLSLDTIAILVAATGAQILYCSFHPHLPLHTTGAAAVSQCLNLCAADKVKVMLNAVLETGGCHGKVDCFLAVITGNQAVNKASAEAVTAANAIHNVNAVGLGEKGFFPVIEHTRPLVVIGRNATAQGNCYLFAAKSVTNLSGHINVSVAVELTALDVRSYGGNIWWKSITVGCFNIN